MSQPTVPHHPPADDAGATVPHQPVTSVSAVPAPAQATVPHQPIVPPPRATVPRGRTARPAPVPPPVAARLPGSPARPAHRRSGGGWRWLALGTAALGLLACALTATLALAIYGSGILPGVRVGGVALGGMDEAQARDQLIAAWGVLTLTDPDTGAAWNVVPGRMGIHLDADASARLAYRQGRDAGNLIPALVGLDLPPVVWVDAGQAAAHLRDLRHLIDTPPLNAGVQLLGGVVSERPARDGRLLDVDATIARLQADPTGALIDGRLSLVLRSVPPAVASAGDLVEAARALLSRTFTVRAYDPVTGDSAIWQAQPEQWAGWLVADPDPTQPTGLRLSFDPAPLAAFLTEQAQVFDATRRLELDRAIEQIQSAIRAGHTQATIRVYHNDRLHTVQAGETIISIAWDYGVPYPWVQRANGGIEAISAGQVITIPSPDNFFPHEPIPDKRIVVSLSRQRAWVYENGALKWEWVVSTGISSSPTWPGVYQIISHVPNAYAANWNLWMPHFLGVYQPVPGTDFTNGFHGFPTRGNSQLLWTNSLGTRVTYGCILLDNTNARLLYDWAEEGVIVEITR